MLSFILTFVFMILCIIHKDLIFSSTQFSIEIWIKSIFPALFISFIAFDLFKTSKSSKNISFKFNNILRKIFHFKYKESSYLFIMSLFSGTPTSAKLVSDALENNLIDECEANHLLCFNTFQSPTYLLSLAYVYFSNVSLILYFIISHYLANIIFGIFKSKVYNKENIYFDIESNYNELNVNYFSNSLIKNTNVILSILGYTAIFNVFLNLVFYYLKLTNLNKSIFMLFFEQILAINYINKNITPSIYISFIVLFFITFLGLCTFIEIKTMVPKVKFKSFLLSRTIASFFSIIIFILLLLLSNNLYLLFQ